MTSRLWHLTLQPIHGRVLLIRNLIRLPSGKHRDMEKVEQRLSYRYIAQVPEGFTFVALIQTMHKMQLCIKLWRVPLTTHIY
jgi:hypothetical protein